MGGRRMADDGGENLGEDSARRPLDLGEDQADDGGLACAGHAAEHSALNTV